MEKSYKTRILIRTFFKVHDEGFSKVTEGFP